MTTIKYFSYNVWVIFAGEQQATPFFDLVACDIESAKADISHTYKEEFTVVNYTQKEMVKEVKYKF